LTHHFWIKVFGANDAALRSISVIFELLDLFYLFKLGELLFNKRVGIIAALFLSLSPWHVWISQNARSNSMLLCLTIISYYAFVHLIQTNERKWIVSYCIITTIAIYTHYFAFMVWFTQIIYFCFVLYKERQLFKNYLKSIITISAAYFIWLPFMISQFITKTRPMYKEFSLSFLRDLFDFLNPYTSLSNNLIFSIGEALFISIFIYAGYLAIKVHNNSLEIAEAKQSQTSFPKKTFLRWFLASITLGYIVAAIFLSTHRLLPLVRATIEQNNPIIYADKVKYYHIHQVQSFKISFVIAAAIAMLLYFMNLYIEAIAEKLADIIGHIREKLSKRNAGSEGNPKILLFLFIHLVLPLLLASIISLKSPYLLLRNMVVIIPPYLLLMSFAISKMNPQWLQVVTVSALVFFAVDSFKHFEAWNTKNDWREAAMIARMHMKENDVLLLDHLFGKKPFYYYGVKTVKPRRRDNYRQLLDTIDGDLWLLVSYKNEWTIRDSLIQDFEKVDEWTFPGTNNKDDMHPTDGSIHLIHYRRKHLHRVGSNLAQKMNQNKVTHIESTGENAGHSTVVSIN